MRNSATGKHIGEEPSQQPPDWWNSTGPWSATISARSCSASGVAVTLSAMESSQGGRRRGEEAPRHRFRSEEAELLRAIADQHVLRLLVVVEHHLVVLSPDAGLLVAAERRVRRIGVVTVGPDAARLDRAAEAVAAIDVAAPHTSAEAVQRVIGYRERFFVRLERRHRNDRAEDFFLENAHPVVPLEHGRLYVVSAGQFPGQAVALAADQDFGAFLLADVDVGENLLQLLGRSLSANHHCGIERVALNNRIDALQRALHEAVVDRLLDERAARTGADLALVEREHDKAFDRLVEEVVVLGAHVLEKDIGRLAAELERDWNQVLRGVLHDEPARRRLAGERDLGNTVARGER